MKRAPITLLATLFVTSGLYAQQPPRRESLSITDVARPVAVDPGGEIILRGAVRSSYDGSVIDALTTAPGATGVEGEGSAVPGGLYDIDAGGWRLVSRDQRTHAYRLAATGVPGAACTEAGVRSPCLPLRLLPLAQTRLLAVADFARTVSGEITLEVLDPDSTPARVPPFIERYAIAMGLSALAFAGAFVAMRALQRRASSPEAMLRGTAARVRAKLASGDPVHRQLAPSIDGLVTHATELASLRDRLQARVGGADRDGLVRRRDALAAKERDGVTEAARARALVDEQIERVDGWKREAERASARIAEVHEYLRTLLQRLDESIGAAASERDESTRAALRELETEVQAAIEGAREADRLVG